MKRYPECERCARIVGPVNFWSNIGLMILKRYFGIFAGSKALIADAFHSFGDVIISILFLIGLHFTGKPPDEDHHFGYGKIEFTVSAIIGIILFCGGFL